MFTLGLQERRSTGAHRRIDRLKGSLGRRRHAVLCCVLAVCSSQAGTAFAPPWARLAQRPRGAGAQGRAGLRPLSICMLNRAKKNAQARDDDDDDGSLGSLFSAESSSTAAEGSDPSDFSGWHYFQKCSV
jgi:hypothetical protein